MKTLSTALLISLLAMGAASGAGALVVTFDDIPQGNTLYLYSSLGLHFETLGCMVVDHSNSSWGQPHSGSQVLVKDPDRPQHGGFSLLEWMKGGTPKAFSAGGYFSTEYGAILELQGFGSGGWPPISLATIGAADQAWNNVYVDVSSPSDELVMLGLREVSPGAFDHFCVDDITINFVPEPSSLSILSLALASAGAWKLRRRR